jgi:mannose-6-phosphate isomerase-like protein (cupin superfamily)
MVQPFDLEHVYLHLGTNAAVTPLPDFEWSAEYLANYEARFADDGPEGRLVVVSPQTETWTTWERHPAGDEVVYLLTGRVDVVQDDGSGREVLLELRAGEAIVNPRNVWHRSIVHEPGSALFITPGKGTEHRPVAGEWTA